MEPQKVSGTYSLPYTIQTEWTGYLIFSILFGPIAILGIFATLKNPSTWPLLLIALVLLSTFLIWIKSFKILIKEDRLIYNTLFSRNNKVMFSNINKLEIKIGVWGDESAKKNAYYRFNIYTRSSEKPLTINMKPFGKRDLAILADAIVTKVPSVKMDELTHQLKEGNFKPIVSEGIRKIWQIALLVLWIFLALAIFHALAK